MAPHTWEKRVTHLVYFKVRKQKTGCSKAFCVAAGKAWVTTQAPSQPSVQRRAPPPPPSLYRPPGTGRVWVAHPTSRAWDFAV